MMDIGADADPTRPRRGDRLVATALGDGLLVFDPDRVRAHVLNRSATQIWEACDGTRTPPEIGAVVAETAEPPTPPGIIDDVVAAIRTMVTEGLVDPAPGQGHPGAAPDAPVMVGPVTTAFDDVEASDEPAPPAHRRASWTHSSGPYRGLDFGFEVHTDDEALSGYLAGVLRSLSDPTVLSPHQYTVVDDGATWTIALDGFLIGRGLIDALVAQTLLWHVNQAASSAADGRLLLHASAAVIGPAGATSLVAFPAAMDSGKSTLVTGLVRAGAVYVTDETTAIDLSTRLVPPYPKAIALDPGSWMLFPDLAPPASGDHGRFAPRKWHLEPGAVGAVAAVPELLAAVVFPRFEAGAASTLTRLEPPAAALGLAENCFNLAAIGRPGVELIAALAQSIPCWSLRFGDLDDAVALVGSLAPGATPDAAARLTRG